MRAVRARELMRKEVFTVSVDADVFTIAREFARRGITGAPVVDRENRVVGVVSQSDLIRFIEEQAGPNKDFYAESEPDVPRDGPTRTAAELMTPDVIAAGPDVTVDELSRMMLKRGVHRVLIMEDGKLLGIVTTMDILGST